MMPTTRKRWAVSGAIGVNVAVAILLTAAAAQAQLQRLFRADDGTAYQLLWLLNPSPGAETFRVTTIAGSSFGVDPCFNDLAMMSGEPVSAVAGTQSPPLPYLSVMRTFLLTPNSATGEAAFDRSGSGRLTLGSGSGALHVCSVFDDCLGHGIIETLVALSSDQGNVPPACITGIINSACPPLLQRAALAFGLPSTGEPPMCNDTAQVTFDTTLCAPAPVDGFTLGTGQAIVFVYGGLTTSAFEVSVAGFCITTDDVNSFDCPANSVVGADAAGSVPPFPLPTDTPIRSPVGTPTITATGTPIRGGPIPIISSPFGPAGLLLVVGLAGGLLYAMRRPDAAPQRHGDRKVAATGRVREHR